MPLNAAVKDILAGTSAGLVSMSVCHPLDTIRVRLQTAASGRFTGPIDVVRQTLQHEGVRGLYKGILSPLVSQALQKATMFYSFGAAKRFMTELNTSPAQTLPLYQLYLCGAFAGVSNACVANPFELVRNRLQVQYTSTGQYRGPVDVVRQMIAAGGVRSLYLGLAPMMIRDAPGVGAWYATFEGVRRLLVPEGENPSVTPKWKILLAGASAGVGFWICAFPQDTIKNVIQTRGMASAAAASAAAAAIPGVTPSAASAAAAAASTPALGFFATGAKLVRDEGVMRLWRGFSIAALRGIPGASTTFLTYQLVINEINAREAAAAAAASVKGIA
jgi:hypothetical protein